jgi:hypothetical protein
VTPSARRHTTHLPAQPHRLADLDAWLEDFRAAMEANYARLDALLADTAPERTDPDALETELER